MCDVPSCVNPKHLRVATQAENNADKEAKGRGVRITKVPDSMVLEIRRHVGEPKGWHTRIAKQLGLTRRYVGRVADGSRRTNVA
jgi:hypothetical protein